MIERTDYINLRSCIRNIIYIFHKFRPGSEHYILSQLKDELQPIGIIYKDKTINNDYPIFILDDAIYS